ncbi:hypothetical protein H0H81_001533 [Sphagnurus paluster]|uniref:Uncharacterized protein n=1 Tax=Sphagnurus paluster TaxID=117069 RepID=A0A9P7FLM3_9AGAR|nr:hypothetical protein H0H81_004341 [Sphagnurus paluster]KAG5649905.1 hypothetical protein H0H81_001533 [Sphagnurus paluster]
MSTPARSASLAVCTVGSFLESLNEAWEDFVADLDAGDDVTDSVPFLASRLETLAGWPAVYSGIWAEEDAARVRLLEFVREKGLQEVYPSLAVAWTEKQRCKWTRCVQLHAERPEACFEDELPTGSQGPSMSRPSASPFVFGLRPPVLTPLSPRLVELPTPEVLPSHSQTLGTQMPKSPSPVPGPSRHPNRLPSAPPMDEDEEEPLPHENDGPAPTDEETDARPPAESDDNIEMVDEEPEAQESRDLKPAAQDEDEDEGKWVSRQSLETNANLGTFLDEAETTSSPNKRGEKRTLEDDDADEDEEEPAGRPKPRRKRSKKSVPVVEDSNAAVEVPAPATPREPKPRKPKAKGSRQERWAAMSSTDRVDLAATVESHIAGEFDGAPLDLAEVDDLGIPNLSRAALAHWNYAKSTIAPAPCDQCTKGGKPCLVHTGPASCFLCLKSKAKCSLVPEKPKGKPKGKGKGKAKAKDEEPEVPRSKKGKKPKKTEDAQEQSETGRGRILGFSERLPSLMEPYAPTSAPASTVMAWSAPAEFFALDVRGLPTPNGRAYKAVGLQPISSMHTLELRRERVELEDRDETSPVDTVVRLRREILYVLLCALN